MDKVKQLIFALLPLLLLPACTPSVPDQAVDNNMLAKVFPDNSGATLPPNIAPLNFRVQTECDECIVRIAAAKTGNEIVVRGPEVDIDVDDWHKLLDKAKGGNLLTDIFVRHGDTWYKFVTIVNPVALEPVDQYLTYRLIEPSYVDYEDMVLCQRDVTSFDERVLYSNRMHGEGDNGQCINCHVAQDYNRQGHSQFHVRQYNGGTVFIDDGKVTKVNLKTASTLSAGVYPAWHPKQELVAYSVNETGQVFHTRDLQKIEVLDYASDLILYDRKTSKVYDIDNSKDEFETFPAWSPAGDMLYYASAHYVRQTDDIDAELDSAYQSLKYNVYSRTFDSRSKKFGERRLVLDAAAMGKSASFPRVSPDGRYLLMALADYGQFHIWHRSSDLYVLDLKTGVMRELRKANSPDTESYHNWSSNGRWIVFASRRDDGSYTRLYVSYFDRQGIAHKPFLLPQQSADYYENLFKSYNVPEWMVNKVKPDMMRITTAVGKPAVNAVYGGSALATPDPATSSKQIRDNKKENFYD